MRYFDSVNREITDHFNPKNYCFPLLQEDEYYKVQYREAYGFTALSKENIVGFLSLDKQIYEYELTILDNDIKQEKLFISTYNQIEILYLNPQKDIHLNDKPKYLGHYIHCSEKYFKQRLMYSVRKIYDSFSDSLKNKYKAMNDQSYRDFGFFELKRSQL